MDEVERANPAGGASARSAHGLEEWVRAVAADLGIDPAVANVSAVLDLARDAADGVGRPAAPLTTFLLGYAAGMSGGDRETMDRLIARLGELARNWAEAPDGAASASRRGTGRR